MYLTPFDGTEYIVPDVDANGEIIITCNPSTSNSDEIWWTVYLEMVEIQGPLI
jgi:lipocalin